MPDERVCYLTAARELQRFEFAGARADIRGWIVVAGDGRAVGVVERLLVEQATGRVRWITIALALEDGHPGRRAPESVLVPVGLIQRHGDGEIGIDGLTVEQIARSPRLRQRPVMRSDERAALVAYGMRPPGDRGASFYGGPQFDDERGLCKL